MIKFSEKNSSGFTMVELMVVVALIGILAGIAVPNILSNLPTFRLKSGARQLMTDINYTRSLAVKTNNDHKIQFYPGTGSYKIYKRDSLGGWTGSSIRDVDELEEKKILVEAVDVLNDQWNECTNCLIINPLGECIKLEITLKNSKNQTLLVETSMVGRVKAGQVIN